MKKAFLITLVVLAVGVGLILVGRQAETADVAERNRAFLQAMVPHHRSAVAMAQVAQQRAVTPEIRRLAADISGSQEQEIVQMKRIHQRLFGTELTPHDSAHDRLDLSASEAGMNHGAESTTKLRTANPFDQAFIEEMIPHHQGAIRMARAVLETTKDDEIRKLAQDIIDAQEREVKLMNEVRLRVYGAAATSNPSSSNEHGGHGGS